MDGVKNTFHISGHRQCRWPPRCVPQILLAQFCEDRSKVAGPNQEADHPLCYYPIYPSLVYTDRKYRFFQKSLRSSPRRLKTQIKFYSRLLRKAVSGGDFAAWEENRSP